MGSEMCIRDSQWKLTPDTLTSTRLAIKPDSQACCSGCLLDFGAIRVAVALGAGAAGSAAVFGGSTCSTVAACLHFAHGEDAVVAVFGGVLGVELTVVGRAVVDLFAAGQQAQIGVALERVDLAVVSNQHRQFKFERDDLQIRGVKLSVVVVLSLIHI